MSLYDVLGVPPDCDEAELRAAYRTRAREVHPDTGMRPTHGTSPDRAMAELNAAWTELSDPAARARYDQTLAELAATPEPVAVPQPSPQSNWSRRQAWVAGVQAQIIRLAGLAGRSATQTLLLRSARATRAEYEAIVTDVVAGLAIDTESRVRAARAAGAAPLDLGVAATLIGVRALADQLRRNPSHPNSVLQADLLDRMWDILAHELPAPLELALGGNPHVARILHAA